ncbi:hypothetical protein CGZ95_16180 [Enemella evansiae]|nr:hypothetical protein CGZ95_16180 [Enemella evansiae]
MPDAPVLTTEAAARCFVGHSGHRVWRTSAQAAELGASTLHGLRQGFHSHPGRGRVHVGEVSEWAGHNSVAFTLTRYGGLFQDNSHAAVDRLDALLGGE